ncbi:hypothetical protein GCM10010390_92690 [Streptomyces mordarskii]|uniref:Uncharacterized protein n=1 Tax=Streptomyces mordarskii TaxID=1226758 RepID=A0ABN1EUV2_9ACTN
MTTVTVPASTVDKNLDTGRITAPGVSIACTSVPAPPPWRWPLPSARRPVCGPDPTPVPGRGRDDPAPGSPKNLDSLYA